MSDVLGLKLFGERRITRQEAAELRALGHKYCSQCDTVKPLLMFNNSVRSKDGKQPRCKTCTQENNEKYRGSGSGVTTSNILAKHRRGEELSVDEIVRMPMCVLNKLSAERRVKYLEIKIENNELYKFHSETRRVSYKG